MNLLRTFFACALVSLVFAHGNAMHTAVATAKQFGSKVYTAGKDVAVAQSKNAWSHISNHPYLSAGIATGLIATGVAAKYAAPYVTRAAIRAKINGQKLVGRITPYADTVKQGVVTTAKVGAVATVLALPVIAAYADAHQEAICSTVSNGFAAASSYVANNFETVKKQIPAITAYIKNKINAYSGRC